jgi:hypothetical protein
MEGMTDSALPFKKQKSYAPLPEVDAKRIKTDTSALPAAAAAGAPSSIAVDVTAPLLDLGELVPATLVARPR